VSYLADIEPFVSDILPVFWHYYTGSRSILSFASSKSGRLANHRFGGDLEALYQSYNKYVSMLNNSIESGAILQTRGPNDDIARHEERRLAMFRMLRVEAARKTATIVRSLCERQIATLRATKWETDSLQRNAEEQIALLLVVRKHLQTLGDSFEQTAIATRR
jgi:uncharacterized protein (DUF1501 family)